jgi:hypothetical protein
MNAKFWWENLKGRDQSKDKGVDAMIILERILEKKELENVNWIHLVQDRKQWWALAKMITNLRVP